MRAGDEGGDDCGVHPRTAWNSVADLRGRNFGCLVARSSEAPREPTGGLRSAKSGSVERGEQERPDRCAKVGRDVTHQPTQVGVPRRAWITHPEGVGTQRLEER